MKPQPNEEKYAHAIQNAKSWSETITALVAAMNADYDRLDELREERAELAEAVKEAENARQEKDRHGAQVQLNEWDAANGAELADLRESATVDGSELADADTVRERIQESALEVLVRGDWHSPGQAHDALTPVEFTILLTTGGPACRIRGELDEHCQPTRAWLEYQDWGTPWMQLFTSQGAPSQDTLIEFASVFYFGE